VISRNLRHLRIFLAVAELGSVTLAASRHNVSQPAVTQAVGKLEAQAGGALFDRTRQGFFLTERGRMLADRVRRALALLDPALAEVSPRLQRIATSAQLEALIAVREAENFTLAAQRLGLAQPTVHRAVTQLEHEAEKPLFQRAAFGLVATRPARALAQAARLAFAELEQAEADLAEFDGREVGQIVIGSLPLSRSVLLPQALVAFRKIRPRLPVKVIDGPYDALLAGLRRGDIDVIVGALRDPAPIGDVEQERLFDDRLAIVARRGHPLAGRTGLTPRDLARHAWVVPRGGTPSRAQFDAFFAPLGAAGPDSIIESGSILLMREVLGQGDFLGCISDQQAEAEISKGLLIRLDVDADWPGRAIGLTTRIGWVPTKAQKLMLELLRETATGIGQP
jgi:LysR family transcriptional regulator of gallate degradation